VPQSIESKRTKDLSEEELTKLREEVDKYTTEGDLRRYVALNIKRLKEIGCYRGRRHYNVSSPRGGVGSAETGTSPSLLPPTAVAPSHCAPHSRLAEPSMPRPADKEQC
jgi:hypothetical protein